MMRLARAAVLGMGLAVLGSWMATVSAADDAKARQLMEQAFNLRYRWGADLKGFSADFSLTRDGKTTQGKVTVALDKPRGGVEVTSDDESAKSVVRQVLGST